MSSYFRERWTELTSARPILVVFAQNCGKQRFISIGYCVETATFHENTLKL